MSGVRGIDHINLRAPAELIERLRTFYIDVIGLRQGPRPNFGPRAPGYWLYAGEQEVLHLSVLPALTGVLAASTGTIAHYALACTDLAGMRRRLDRTGVRYAVEEVPALDQVQLFLRDPAGTTVELIFRRADGYGDA